MNPLSLMRPRQTGPRPCGLVAMTFCALWGLAFSGVKNELMAEVRRRLEIPVTNFEQLCSAAEQLAQQAFQPQPEAPAFLREMNYDQVRHIQFNSGNAIWGNTRLPFRLGFYHKGYVHQDDVAINLLRDGESEPTLFSTDYFHYIDFARDLEIPDDLGFAGFRVIGAYPGREQLEEMISFVGASYFRSRPETGSWGTSARGLAINAGLPAPEEFPVFREFWITKPEMDDDSLTALALLDSPSVCGAYEFQMRPGARATVFDVRAQLHFRQVPEKVGLGPMSSMWMWGDGLAGPEGDHRPEVHDADGLQIEYADGRWLWRALSRQTYPSLVRFPADQAKGFGFLQRDRDRSHYLDDEAHYHNRPGVWIEPTSDWGNGAIELLELPAPHEGIDNMAAWWVPASPVVVGEPLSLAYRIHFFMGDRPDHRLGKAIGFTVDREEQELLRIAVEFALPGEDSPQSVEPQATCIRGDIKEARCEETGPGSWVATLDIRPAGDGPIELTLLLKEGDVPLTETWAALCPLEPPPVSLPPWRLKELEEAGELPPGAQADDNRTE